MSFKLTQQGITASEVIQEPRDKDTKVLAFMYSMGKGATVELEEVQDRLRTDTENTIRVMTRLQNTGYVEEI
jgi:hypothetical protein